MKTKLFFILLFVGLCSVATAQKGLIDIISYPDTVSTSDTLMIVVESLVEQNGAPCSPLTSTKDTLIGSKLDFDLTFDFTNSWCTMCPCLRTDTLYYLNLPQLDSILLSCYYTYVDSTSSTPQMAYRLDTASVVVHIANVTGLKEQKHNIGFNVFPNPSNGSIELNIESANPGKYYVKVIDVLGNLVHIEEILFNGQSHKIDLQHLNKGMYLVSLENEKEKLTKKIVLK